LVQAHFSIRKECPVFGHYILLKLINVGYPVGTTGRSS
jgi:hypothetical protein